MILRLWYTFLVQMFFNYHTMVSVGACYLLDKLMEEDDIPQPVRLRLLIFFNGHPYLIPYAISAIARELKNGTDIEKIDRFINGAVGFLGITGDRYFWNGMKPLMLLLPILIYVATFDTSTTLIASITTFLWYNIAQIRERLMGLRLGDEMGFSVISHIKRLKESKLVQYIPLAALIVVSTILTLYIIEINRFAIPLAPVLLALGWGVVAGWRGNNRKYYAAAIITFGLFEIFS